jgi:hypothetical protein
MRSATISTLQKAGSATRAAYEAVKAEVVREQQMLHDAMEQDAFDIATDRHFENLKSASRMAQALLAMEEQLRQFYHSALSFDDPQVLPPPLLAQTVDVVDIAVLAPTRKAKKAHKPKPSTARHRAVVSSTPRVGGRRQTNADLMWRYLGARLSSDSLVRLTHAELAKAIPIPLGSVGAALTSLIKRGQLVEGSKGAYRLA